MTAVYKRELRAYFTTPIGYIYLAAWLVLCGFYWFAGSLVYGSSDLSVLFGNLFTISCFLTPVLTMRLFSEERRHRTDQLLLTSPVSLSGLVLGKYASALTVYAMGVSVTLVYGLVMSRSGPVDWPVLFGNVLGLLLLGSALIGLGIFLSSLTENQVVAAISGFASALLLMVVDAFAAIIPWEALADFVQELSFYYRYQDFTVGLVDLPSVLFFLSFGAVFCLLTVRVLDRKRWC